MSRRVNQNTKKESDMKRQYLYAGVGIAALMGGCASAQAQLVVNQNVVNNASIDNIGKLPDALFR